MEDIDIGPWAIAHDYLLSAMSASTKSTAFSPGRGYSVDEARGIATVNLEGTLSRGGSFWGGTSTSAVGQEMRALAANPKIKGILLNVNSPGGYASGTKDLADIVREVSSIKPVYASINDIGASAAYWIASQATQVFAAEDAAVGSIGTYTVLPDMSRMAENAGVTVHVIRADQSGEHKGAGVPGAPVTDSQLAEIKRMVTARNEFFLDGVSSGRGMPRAQLDQIADGRVFMAKQAVDLGLVDEVASNEQVLSKLIAATSAKTENRIMSDEKKVEDTKAKEPVVDLQAQPLTVGAKIVQLKQACPGASSDQILSWLETDAPVSVAQGEYIAKLVQSVQELQSKSLAEQAPVAAAAVKETKETPFVGVQIVADQEEQTNGTATESYYLEVAKLQKQGMSRRDAISKLRVTNNNLVESYIAEANGHV